MANVEEKGIILLGLPRSGTTLLRRLLDAHPAIACPGETFLLRGAARFLESETVALGIDYGPLGALSTLGFAEDELLGRLRGLCVDFHQRLAAQEGKRRWAMKTAVDSFYLPSVRRLFEGHARFVCILRHGLDAVLSLEEFCGEMQGYAAELHEYVRRFPRPKTAFAHAWADISTALKSFAEERPEEVWLLRYEDLVTEPTKVLPGLFEFLGEPWSEDLLERAFAPREVKGLGDWKTFAMRGFSQASLGRWKSLSPAAIAELAPIVNPVLERCGYPAVGGEEQVSSAEAMRRYELAMMFKMTRGT